MQRHHIPLLLSMFVAPFVYAQNIFQVDIPLEINEPGTYVLQENVTYKHFEDAIKIKSDNVILDFNGFSLTLTKHKANGVVVKKSTAFTIENGMISSTSSKENHGVDIKIGQSNGGTVQNMLTVGNRNGLDIRKSQNIQVLNSNFSQARKAAALVEKSTDITFNNDIFADSNNGLMLSGANENIVLSNSTFPSASFSNLLAQQGNNIMVDKCIFDNVDGDPAKLNLVQFGDADPSQVCNDITIRYCIIRNRPAPGGNTAPEGLGLYQGSGFLVDSCVIDIDNTDQDPAADLSGIHVSNPGLGTNGTIASNVIIRNCIIQGPATDGLYPDVGSSNVLIENNLVSGAAKDGIFVAGTTGCTVIGNTVVNNATNGIFVGEVSPSNAIINNVVNNNGFDPITSSLPPFGNGISIASDSSFNLVQGNDAFNNAVNGIDNEGANNQIFGNNAFGNGNQNFHSVSTIVVSSAGAATLAGANISA
jgi:parallel beta-helix repeat protein